jgi:hypothetical protein
VDNTVQHRDSHDRCCDERAESRGKVDTPAAVDGSLTHATLAARNLLGLDDGRAAQNTICAA